MFHLPAVSLDVAAGTTWDVAVVGAGPAGAMAAFELARRGVAVLLVDRKAFPRWKVCGGYLSGRALRLLASAGLDGKLAQLGGNAIHEFNLWSGGLSARVPLPAGLTVSRYALDATLVDSAIAVGARFLPEAQASLESEPDSDPASRRIALKHAKGSRCTLHSRVVIAADGLGGSFLSRVSEIRHETTAKSRIGGGGITRRFPYFYQKGRIYMAVGRHGYVGLVRLEDGRLNVGAALDREFVRQSQGPGQAMAAIIEEAGLPAVDLLPDFSWHGTAALTRRVTEVAAHRVFVVGDAAGYVEPFTGEGITWALHSAQEVVPLVLRGIQDWDPRIERDWRACYQRGLRRRQRLCRVLAFALRRPFLVRGGLRLLSAFPGLANPVVRRITLGAAT